MSETAVERRLREIAEHGTTGSIYEPSREERAACLDGADALRREREAAERKAQFVALQQRIEGHLDVCIYCENALTSECAVGRALLKDSKDYYKKDAPTEPTR